MPQIHLGTYLTSGHKTTNAVKWALEVMIPRIMSLGDRSLADDSLRLDIERNGGKSSLVGGNETDAR